MISRFQHWLITKCRLCLFLAMNDIGVYIFEIGTLLERLETQHCDCCSPLTRVDVKALPVDLLCKHADIKV